MAADDLYDDTGAWYLSPMAQYTLLDHRRDSKDGYGYQVGLGYDFSPHVAAEFAIGNGSFHLRGSGASEKLQTASVDVLYKILSPDHWFRPYMLAGAGAMSDDLGRASQTHQAPLLEAGAGLLTGLGSQSGSTRIQFRTEAKYRYQFVSGVADVPRGPGDVVFGAGFQFMFGAPTPPPPPVAKAAPPVEEPPPPPPPPPPPQPVDSDGDGVPDSIDRCPNTPKGDIVDAYGCTIKDEIKLEGVNFATNSADLVPESTTVLDYGVATLKKHPDLVIEVRGYTDSTGSAPYNLQLSRRRAEAVMRYLQDHGATNSLTAKGFGKEHPIADNSTADGRMQNRRVTLHIMSGS
jgi:outer membrane protein OmpA-like peptidoglycan-associated protein